MAFEYGFYNSINSDRKYNAIQFGQIFDGVINDGVFLSIGEKFATLAAGGMDVTVGTGKAWFNHTWSLNTTKIPFTLDGSHPVLSRYDAIILEINDSPDVYGRVNSIKVVKGEPSSNAVKPPLVNDQYIHQYPLSYVKINPGATDLTAADIEIMVGRDPCPYVTGILQTTDITDLYNNWEGQFNIWFNNLKAQLTDNVVANLQAQIDACLKPTDIATTADINNGTPGKLVDASGLKNDAKLSMLSIGDIYSTQIVLNDSRFRQCMGNMYRVEKYPEWWNAVKSFFNKFNRTVWGEYRTVPTNSTVHKRFIVRISDSVTSKYQGEDLFCTITSLTAYGLSYEIYSLYNFDRWSYSITFRNTYLRSVFNIIKKVSIKGSNSKNTYILLNNGPKLTVIEIVNGLLANSNTVTEFTRDLSLDAIGSVNLNDTNSYVVLENDTFHVYYVYGNSNIGLLYYFSFYLDRVNKEVRLVTKNTQISVVDQDGVTLNAIAKMSCPGIIADSGNIYFGALSGDKKRLLMLKITNKTTCSVVNSVAPSDSTVVYNTSFYRIFDDDDSLYIHAIGRGTSNNSDGSYPASTCYITVNPHDENTVRNVENRMTTYADTPISKMFYYLSGGGSNVTLGFLNTGAIVIYYSNYIWIVHASLFYNVTNGLSNPLAYFYVDLGSFTPHVTNGESLLSKMYDYGYISPDYYMLLYPINNNTQYIYYPELSTPNTKKTSLGLGYIDHIKVKP